jgi:hypothetical protein
LSLSMAGLLSEIFRKNFVMLLHYLNPSRSNSPFCYCLLVRIGMGHWQIVILLLRLKLKIYITKAYLGWKILELLLNPKGKWYIFLFIFLVFLNFYFCFVIYSTSHHTTKNNSDILLAVFLNRFLSLSLNYITKS